MTDEQTDAIATEVLKWLQGARETIETQAPVMAREVIRYAYISDVLGLVMAFVFLGAGGLCFYAFMQEDEGTDMCIFWGVGMVLGALIGCILFFAASFDLVWAITAPHWYVLHALLPHKS